MTTIVREFDHHDCPGVTADPFLAFERHRTEPIFYSSAYGGFWVPTRFADIRAVLRDTATFSSRQSAIPAVEWPRPLIPVELDRPDHAKYRTVLTRFLTGPDGDAIGTAVGKKCVELAKNLAPQGQCDVLADYSGPIQAAMFAALFDLPGDHLDDCARWAGDLSQGVEAKQRLHALRAIREYLTDRVARQGAGLIGALAAAEVDGGPLPASDIVDISFVMVLASVFTVTNTIGFSFRHLTRHPRLRRRLADDPSFSATAAEELLRLYSVTNTVRTATRDTTLAGARIAAGDRILLCLSLADRDPDVYPDPESVRFDRPKTPGHLAYGSGPHRCLGARIASQALTAALAEWHRRIPDYAVTADAAVITGGGSVCSLDVLPLHWPP